MLCSKCKKEIENDSKFCTYCGNTLNKNENFLSKIDNIKTKHTNYCKLCGEELDENKKCIKCGKQYFNIFKIKNNLVVIILIILLVISLSISIYQFIKKEQLKKNIINLTSYNKSLESELEVAKSEYYELYLGNALIERKANFLDEHIVFVVKGYGNYFYTYDEMQTKDLSAGYWAYQKEAAIGKGYINGN